jgi:hypothetical protein
MRYISAGIDMTRIYHILTKEKATDLPRCTINGHLDSWSSGCSCPHWRLHGHVNLRQTIPTRKATKVATTRNKSVTFGVYSIKAVSLRTRSKAKQTSPNICPIFGQGDDAQMFQMIWGPDISQASQIHEDDCGQISIAGNVVQTIPIRNSGSES